MAPRNRWVIIPHDRAFPRRITRVFANEFLHELVLLQGLLPTVAANLDIFFYFKGWDVVSHSCTASGTSGGNLES